jgi:hypothetical protein
LRRGLPVLSALARAAAQARLQQIPPHANDRIAWFWLKKADFTRTGAESDDTEGLIDHIRAIEPVVVACVFEEIEPGTDAHQPALQKRQGERERNLRAVRRRRPSGGGGRAHSRHAAFRAAQGHRRHQIEPDKQNRIVLTREIRNAAGFQPGEPLQITASPGRIVLEVKPESSGKIIKKGGLKVWTGKVPPIPLDEAVNMSRHYSR